MDFNDYQRQSKQTAQGLANPDGLSGIEEQKRKATFLALAINGESGELAEKVKKYVREDDPSYLVDAYWELGDVLWYLSQFASLMDEEFGAVAEDNLAKLRDRNKRDKITGEGDNR